MTRAVVTIDPIDNEADSVVGLGLLVVDVVDVDVAVGFAGVVDDDGGADWFKVAFVDVVSFD